MIKQMVKVNVATCFIFITMNEVEIVNVEKFEVIQASPALKSENIAAISTRRGLTVYRSYTRRL